MGTPIYGNTCPKSPWVSIAFNTKMVNESSDLNAWGYPYFRYGDILLRRWWMQLKNQGNI